MDDEKILIIDWKNKDGSGEYAIRYTLDMEKGNFIITGDVGYCIASWYNHLTPDNLCKFLNNIGYFKEKINCWTESYTYRYKDIKDDLFVLKDDLLNDTDFSEEEIDEDIEEILSMAEYIEKGISKMVMTMLMKGKMCVPVIAPDGSIKLGESALCPAVASIYDTEDVIIDKIKNFHCRQCKIAWEKLKENSPETYFILNCF